MIAGWLPTVSIFALGLGAVCAAVIAFDEARHPQHMWIMSVVWPMVALFGTVLTQWAYFRYGRLATREAMERAKRKGEEPPSARLTPFPVMVGKATAHCGSGCCLGDICAEWLAFFVPAAAVAFGWGGLFQEKIFAVWCLDFLFAFLLGIAFQYFTIKPMRDLSVAGGIVQALKADALSLTAWQVGMYAYMAFAHFFLFPRVLHAELRVDSAQFWFMMQIAMVVGFATSYPANWWLVRTGIKEKM